MRRHFVTFYSPGTFTGKTTTESIPSWDVDLAMEMAGDITDRCNCRPYGFRFSTRQRDDDDLDSREVEKSNLYYLPGAKVRTISDIRDDNNPCNRTLLSNMETNGWAKIVVSSPPWKWTRPFMSGDIILTSKGGKVNA